MASLLPRCGGREIDTYLSCFTVTHNRVHQIDLGSKVRRKAPVRMTGPLCRGFPPDSVVWPVTLGHDGSCSRRAGPDRRATPSLTPLLDAVSENQHRVAGMPFCVSNWSGGDHTWQYPSERNFSGSLLTVPVHRRAKAAFHFTPWMFTRNFLCALC